MEFELISSIYSENKTNFYIFISLIYLTLKKTILFFFFLVIFIKYIYSDKYRKDNELS